MKEYRTEKAIFVGSEAWPWLYYNIQDNASESIFRPTNQLI
jgi:hypothetical protein